MENKEITWEELTKMDQGTILEDYYEDGIRIIILVGPCSLCAYIGIPMDHPLSGHNYDDLNIYAHGGLTYSCDGKSSRYLPKDLWWYGIDYAHSGDYPFYYDKHPSIHYKDEDSIKWLPKMVKDDLHLTIYDFKKLMNLTEKINKDKIAK